MSFSIELDGDNIVQRPVLRPPADDAHKYDRGHAMVFSGPQFRTGASRLAAQAALLAGAGLVTISGSEAALREHAAHVTAIMLQPRPAEFAKLDNRITAMAIGPGYGTGEACRSGIKALKLLGRPLVIDADGLTSFADQPKELFSGLHDQVALTPHTGEFVRLFPDVSLDNRVSAALSAAKRSGAVLLLKGRKSVIAAPDGRFAINHHAASWLATAGAGDVLTGMITGIAAQGVEMFDAACIACWLHGDIAVRHGAGLTADRMLAQIPLVLADCLAE